MTPEFTTSPAYEVSAAMLRERIGRRRTALWKYQKLGLIPRGKRRAGVRGTFFTVHQANRLLLQLGSKAPRF